MQFNIEEMCNQFRVGIARDNSFFRLQIFSQFEIILYDSIVHQSDRTHSMGVSIDLIGGSMSGPSSMPNPQGSFKMFTDEFIF